eukprot:Seg6780.1 transcript_id=Seg6780.1/GoldUCD/mRNA.D3Y31 product="Homeobox protein Wariai" protein_id=Seg6780.1/GoldUCD/D3Y31
MAGFRQEMDGMKCTDAMANIEHTLRSMDMKKPVLSTLAQKGDEKLVELFMTENISLGNETKETSKSQLYVASFWGLHDVVKALIENGTDINCQNDKTKWTPLHAAAFQEHGKVIMLLLESGADPEIEDFWSRTPKDFASASDKIWSLFAASGCTRTTKQELIGKKVLQKSYEGGKQAQDVGQGRKSTASSLLRFDDDSSVGSENSNAYNAAMNGDVLAGSNENQTTGLIKLQQNKTNEQPSFSAWRS